MKNNMKFFFIILLFFNLFFCGCNQQKDDKRQDDRGGLIGTCEDFLGIWRDETGSGGFGIGDTIKFNIENGCKNSTFEQYWSHGGAIHHQGRWERTINSSTKEYIIILRLGEKETVYYFNFFDNYKTLRLKEENSDEYTFYYKRFN